MSTFRKRLGLVSLLILAAPFADLTHAQVRRTAETVQLEGKVVSLLLQKNDSHEMWDLYVLIVDKKGNQQWATLDLGNSINPVQPDKEFFNREVFDLLLKSFVDDHLVTIVRQKYVYGRIITATSHGAKSDITKIPPISKWEVEVIGQVSKLSRHPDHLAATLKQTGESYVLQLEKARNEHPYDDRVFYEHASAFLTTALFDLPKASVTFNLDDEKEYVQIIAITLQELD